MTVRDTTNGFKALARKGTLGQEVFISTTKMDLDDVKVRGPPDLTADVGSSTPRHATNPRPFGHLGLHDEVVV